MSKKTKSKKNKTPSPVAAPVAAPPLTNMEKIRLARFKREQDEAKDIAAALQFMDDEINLFEKNDNLRKKAKWVRLIKKAKNQKPKSKSIKSSSLVFGFSGDNEEFGFPSSKSKSVRHLVHADEGGRRRTKRRRHRRTRRKLF